MGKKSKEKREYRLKKCCKYCSSTEELTIDHKHPVSLGGTDENKNLQTLCKKCNTLKSNIPDKRFRSIMAHGIYCFNQIFKKL